jgi:hypothetical protein
MVTYAPNATTATTLNRSKYKPHDKLPVRVAKSSFNAAANSIPATAQSVNCMTIPAGSIVLAVNIDVTTAEGADTGANIGFTGGAEFCSDGNMAVATQTVCLGVPYLVQAAKKITITANAAALNNCVVDVYAVYVEFDSLSAVT